MINKGQYFQMTNFQSPSYSISSKISTNTYYWYFFIVRSLFLFCVSLAIKLGIWKPLRNVESDIDIYEGKVKPLFLKFSDCENIKEYTHRNQNIDSILYDRKELAKVMKVENNEIEQKWKRRVLIEYTPRGNIIMFYDAYKGGFSYYSDHTVVPIRILNIVAMKYVMRYFCMDFFVDEIALKDNTSPFIRILNEEDKEEITKTKKLFDDLSKKTKIDYKDMPFLKLKNAEPVIKNDSVSKVVKEKRINKFVHLGKIHNYSIIQKKKINQLSNMNNFEDQTYVFKNVNYEDYKKQQKKIN